MVKLYPIFHLYTELYHNQVDKLYPISDERSKDFSRLRVRFQPQILSSVLYFTRTCTLVYNTNYRKFLQHFTPTRYSSSLSSSSSLSVVI